MSAVVTLTLNPAIDQTVTLAQLTPGAVHRASAVRNDAGGKGVNVACCLADWGVPVRATGILGQDNAVPFEQLLLAKGIDDRFVWIPGETRTNLKLLDETRGDTTDVNLPGLAISPGTFDAVRAVLAELTAPGSLVVLAGSLPRGLSPDAYARLGTDLKPRGARVVLDASGPALAVALAAAPESLPYAIKPNRQELEDWAGHPLPTLPEVTAAARALQARGIALVVVSLGAEGALFVSAEEVLHAIPPAMRVASTVGAGDALVAGLVAGLHAGAPLPETARLALAFAAGKLTKPGANLPPRDTVRALAETMRVAALAP
ncbi:1-phosphofructokinase [Methylobacterium soli]|uniref:Phosphofructokinase n=1 Tax=Methylobacterium soli TaxID=553447 RepID=A0A6L3STC7_9HYPH|nr:1-phosphofructokinase [Methylobacterium soli]KAB1076847.1 1-phosphofructokinase [Methylobacterium soli]GJE43671.1 Tagatose-6-phosphate kinase [Methylobacterium soli]